MASGSFLVEGGHQLKGEIQPQGAKNEALQILCATLLTKEQIRIKNLPDIVDVNKLITLLKSANVKIERINKNEYTFQADEINLDYFETEAYRQQAGRLRGSVMLMGPMLARFGKAHLPQPGGDKIGRRRMDTHFIGFQKLGADFNYDANNRRYTVAAPALSGKFVYMEEISVTGTANMVMAAVLAKGQTTIYNAACEPYLQQLCKLMVKMGAKIQGIGSNQLIIDGVDELGGATHEVLPDMIEIGSFISLAVMTQSEIRIKNCKVPELGIIPSVFQKFGIQFEIQNDDIFIPEQKHYRIQTFIDGSILTVYDAPWPGFTPDLMSVLLVMATQAQGSVLIHQKMFESRLFFVDKLIDMGAQIILCDPHRATVIGLDRRFPLRGITMTSPDIRAGVALLIAALSAEGSSTIHNINQIDRGYEDIDIRLNAIGAKIQRITE
ncbi:MAG: UDP-N-acetylglucosamine 1-carboxyvinyltransferase [Bacteroidota bacterium]